MATAEGSKVMGKEFGGDLSGHGIYRWNDPIAWILFIIMGAVLIAWLASSSSPLSTFPAFGHTCPAGSQVNVCGLNSAFKVFSSTAILTGIMTLVVPLGLAMMGEYIYTLGDQEDTFGSRAAKETFYGARRAKTKIRNSKKNIRVRIGGKTYLVSGKEYDALPKAFKNKRNTFLVKKDKEE